MINCRTIALLSLYDADQWITRKIENIKSLPEFGNELGVFIIDAGKNSQNTVAQISTFTNEYPTYVEAVSMRERVSIYEAWNIGILNSSSEFVMNTNVDDLLSSIAISELVNGLMIDGNLQFGLSYATYLVTKDPKSANEFNPDAAYRISQAVPYNHSSLMRFNYIGPCPLWMRSLHEKVGLFDSTMKVAGDWDFWCRASQYFDFNLVNRPICLYAERPDQAEHMMIGDKRVVEIEAASIITKNMTERFYKQSRNGTMISYE